MTTRGRGAKWIAMDGFLNFRLSGLACKNIVVNYYHDYIKHDMKGKAFWYAQVFCQIWIVP